MPVHVAHRTPNADGRWRREHRAGTFRRRSERASCKGQPRLQRGPVAALARTLPVGDDRARPLETVSALRRRPEPGQLRIAADAPDHSASRISTICRGCRNGDSSAADPRADNGKWLSAKA
jgi:hypothetical protein